MIVNDNIHQLLSELGLSSTEQQLYLAGLELTSVTVDWLIRRVGVNRTTAYHALGTLAQKGFCAESKQSGRLVYAMTPAANLEDVLQVREREIAKQKQQLRELASLFPIPAESEATETHVEQYSGEQGVKQAIEKALYCKSRSWDIIAPKDNFFSQIDTSYAKYFMDTRKERKIAARTLWESNSSSDLSLQDLRDRKPRYLPPAFSKRFKSVVILFDDKALFLPSKGRQAAVIVTSDEIVQTLSVMFDALWLAADKPFDR